jgi:hypothetical protein
LVKSVDEPTTSTAAISEASSSYSPFGASFTRIDNHHHHYHHEQSIVQHGRNAEAVAYVDYETTTLPKSSLRKFRRSYSTSDINKLNLNPDDDMYGSYEAPRYVDYEKYYTYVPVASPSANTTANSHMNDTTTVDSRASSTNVTCIESNTEPINSDVYQSITKEVDLLTRRLDQENERKKLESASKKIVTPSSSCSSSSSTYSFGHIEPTSSSTSTATTGSSSVDETVLYFISLRDKLNEIIRKNLEANMLGK